MAEALLRAGGQRDSQSSGHFDYLISGRGRELPRIVAHNDNHDELGRFAEGDSAGAASKSPVEHATDRLKSLSERAGKDPSFNRADIKTETDKLEKMSTPEVKQVAKNFGIRTIPSSKAEIIKTIASRISDRHQQIQRVRDAQRAAGGR